MIPQTIHRQNGKTGETGTKYPGLKDPPTDRETVTSQVDRSIPVQFLWIATTILYRTVRGHLS